MSDGLDVSGGTTSISTDDLEVSIDQLRRLADELGLLAEQLGRVEVPPGPGYYLEQVRVDIDHALPRLSVDGQRAAQLCFLLETAARGYEYQEQVVASLSRSLNEGGARLAGTLAPGLVVSAGLLAAIAGGVWEALRAAGAVKPTSEPGAIPKASPVVRENNRLLNSPGTAGAVRRIVSGVGPFILGAWGTPPIPGIDAFEVGARGVVGGGRAFGLFDETPVRLVATTAQPVTAAPQTYAGRLERVPSSDETGGPQVLIERYEVAGGQDRFEVYVGGTVTFDAVSSSEPWDMTSNVVNATGEISGSVASVMQAMAAAGIEERTPVQLTGYSQGGGVVACVAATGGYNVQGLLSFGGPTGQVDIPTDINTVIVEHTEDIVPALGGEQANTSATLVRREAFAGEEVPDDLAFPSHNIRYYTETARVMDQSESHQLEQALGRLNDFTRGATLVSSTAYRFERDG